MAGSLPHQTEAQHLRLASAHNARRFVTPALGRAVAKQVDVRSAAQDAGHGSAASGTGRSRALSRAELDGQIAAVAAMDHADLRAEWRRLYRSDPPKKIRRDVLELGVAWKLQERVLGGLGASAKRRLADLTGTMAAKGDLAQMRASKLKPGARLMREWGGATYDVTVLEEGFSWRGEQWRSLSAIASEITGTHWSGPRFFGLNDRAKSRPEFQESADA